MFTCWSFCWSAWRTAMWEEPLCWYMPWKNGVKISKFFFVVWLQKQPVANYFSFSSNFTFEKALDFFWERFMQEFNFSPEVGRWERKFTFSFLIIVLRTTWDEFLCNSIIGSTYVTPIPANICQNKGKKTHKMLHPSCIWAKRIMKWCSTYQVLTKASKALLSNI